MLTETKGIPWGGNDKELAAADSSEGQAATPELRRVHISGSPGSDGFRIPAEVSKHVVLVAGHAAASIHTDLPKDQRVGAFARKCQRQY